MPVFVGLAGLALSGASSVFGAAGQAAGAKAQYEQSRINQEWSEFEKQLNLTQQRGAMGLQEFDRLFGNAQIERQSLENLVYGRRGVNAQTMYQTEQLLRASRQAQARQTSTMASRGAGRGGSAEAIANQQRVDTLNDLARIETNEANTLSQLEAQRNQQLARRNMRPTNQPPTYIPATPVQPPNTSGMMTGALLGAIGGGLGGLAGTLAARQPNAGGSNAAQMGPPRPQYVYPGPGLSGPPKQQ